MHHLEYYLKNSKYVKLCIIVKIVRCLYNENMKIIFIITV